MEHTPKVMERSPCRRYDLILNQLNSVFLRWSVKTVSPAVSKAALKHKWFKIVLFLKFSCDCWGKQLGNSYIRKCNNLLFFLSLLLKLFPPAGMWRQNEKYKKQTAFPVLIKKMCRKHDSFLWLPLFFLHHSLVFPSWPCPTLPLLALCVCVSQCACMWTSCRDCSIRLGDSGKLCSDC